MVVGGDLGRGDVGRWKIKVNGAMRGKMKRRCFGKLIKEGVDQ